jgi:hypothetical protein
MEKAFAAMSWGSPIGNIKGPRGISGVITDQGSEPLIPGQEFIDVLFNTIQENPDWIFVECTVFNLVDASPFNIHAGILTGKTTSGFRLQLSGLPDTANYFLRWSINGEPIPPTNASRYLLTGPTAGLSGTASAPFTVKLPASTIVPAPITITPHDGGAGGVFAPTSVTLPANAVAASATFTYTPAASAGTKTIGVTNDSGLTDPAGIGYDVTVPFSPASIPGLKMWLKADSVLSVPDGSVINHWNDSSSNAYNLTSGTATFKSVGGPNGKPFVRFNGTSDRLYTTVDLAIAITYELFIVAKVDASCQILRVTNVVSPVLIYLSTGGELSLYAGAAAVGATDHRNAFHVFDALNNLGGAGCYTFVDGVGELTAANAGSNTPGAVSLMYDMTSLFFAGDIAEILIYSPGMGTVGDRNNVTNYLKTKYGIP